MKKFRRSFMIIIISLFAVSPVYAGSAGFITDAGSIMEGYGFVTENEPQGLSYTLPEVIADSPYFDLEFYIQKNPDLNISSGTNPDAAFTQWLQSGLLEGRIASPYFDVKFYLQQNPDLQIILLHSHIG